MISRLMKLRNSYQDREMEGSNVEEDNLLPLLKQKRKIKWRSGQFHPVIHDFNDENSGFRAQYCNINGDSSFLDYFECFITPELTSKIAFETNRYTNSYPEDRIHLNVHD